MSQEQPRAVDAVVVTVYRDASGDQQRAGNSQRLVNSWNLPGLKHSLRDIHLFYITQMLNVSKNTNKSLKRIKQNVNLRITKVILLLFLQFCFHIINLQEGLYYTNL